MPRIGTKVSGANAAKAPVKKTTKVAAKKGTSTWVEMSHEEPIEQSLVIVIHGKLGAGKTTLAATISEHHPATTDLPRHPKNKPPKYFLNDMFWMGADRKATAGFRERGISVPQFDINDFRTNQKKWGQIFLKQPTIYQAVAFGLQQAKNHAPKYLVFDTVSALDRALVAYWQKQDLPGPQMWGRVLADHQKLYDLCLDVCGSCIFICHSKSTIDYGDETKQAKARKETLSTAAGGLIMPDITGKGQLTYKGDASLQLAVIATPTISGGKRTLKRWASPIATADHETKNRWELSLSDKEEPHLGKMLAKVQA